MQRTPKLDARTRFNRAVLAELEAISPDHAQALNSRGTSLGWWNTIEYIRSRGQSPSDVSRVIIGYTL